MSKKPEILEELICLRDNGGICSFDVIDNAIKYINYQLIKESKLIHRIEELKLQIRINKLEGKQC